MLELKTNHNALAQILNNEAAIVGGLLVNPAQFSECELTPDDFVSENMREVYSAMIDVSKTMPVDMVTVGNQLLHTTKKDWSKLLVDLAVNSTGVFLHLVPQLRVQARLFKAKKLLTSYQGRIDSDGMSAVDALVVELLSLTMTTKQTEFSIAETLTKTVDSLDAKMRGDIDTVPIGIHALDDLLGGFHPSDLVVIGARPSVGKTAFMMNLVMNAKAPLGVISAEQPVVQIGQRLLSLKSGVAAARMRSIKNLEQQHWTRIMNAAALIREQQIWINDAPSMSIIDVMRQARKWKQAYNIRAIYVDYLQRIKSTKTSAPRHEQVGEVASSLKELARELQISVIALAQVSRQVDSRNNKRPGMGDLSDSSEIEKEADQILTLYRDEVYNKNSNQKGVIEISVEKNRHGATGYVSASWDGSTMRVANLEKRYDEVDA